MHLLVRSSFISCLIFALCSCRTPEGTGLSPQNPSPMVDYTRPHHRIKLDSISDAGTIVRFSEEIQGKLYTPEKWSGEARLDLVIHFHGDGRVAQDAVDRQERPWALFHCHWGGGSSAYSRPVESIGPAAFLDTIFVAVRRVLPQVQIGGVYLSGWSAGYGAVRSMIRNEEAARRVDGILLMDGLHCSYLPEGQPLSAGGVLDSLQMSPFLHWAKLAISGKKSFLYTHSSVFPGTYASTTETADYLLQSLSIPRKSLLAEGPVGMQQTSIALRGKLQVLSFAGNSAPDHVDHYYGMGVFLQGMEGDLKADPAVMDK